MNFETKRIDDITILKLNEKRLDTNISGLLKGEFTLLLKVESISKLIVDLSEVESCDSSGLSALLVANRIMESTGGNLIICSLSSKVLSLINITHLDRVLEIRENAEISFNELKNL